MKPLSWLRHGGLSVLLVGATALPCYSDTLVASFSDGTFVQQTTGPWQTTIITTTSQCTIVSSGYSTGGNPNDYRDDNLYFATSPKSYSSRGLVICLDSNATYTPNPSNTFSQLVISFDERQIAGPAGHSMCLEQDGKIFVGPSPLSAWTAGVWISGSVGGVQASAFNEIDTTTLIKNTSSHPDLQAGNTVTFGYCQYGVHNGPSVTSGRFDIDNWGVDVYIH